MRSLDELLDLLRTLEFPVFDTEATGADLTKPYLIVSGAFGNRATETNMCGLDELDDLRVRHVAPSAGVVRQMTKRTRNLLDKRRLHTETQVVDLVRDNTIVMDFDPDVPVPGMKNQHVKQLIDEYTAYRQTL